MMLYGPISELFRLPWVFPVLLLYGMSCNLLIESKNKAIWVAASSKELTNMNDLVEFHLNGYESSALYNENMIMYHDLKT